MKETLQFVEAAHGKTMYSLSAGKNEDIVRKTGIALALSFIEELWLHMC